MSSNNYQQIYINQTLRLAQTIVIKSEHTAETVNELAGYLRMASGNNTPVSPDPRTWKYYLNLSGQYHDTDQVMTVISFDTLEEIVFNKANLIVHRATARAYQHGTREYALLVEKYPEQEQLILGILYPVDLDTAIAAKDGEILSYPPDLVEVNEYSLISKLQEWIYQYKERWYIPGFHYTNELYAMTFLGTLYTLLVPAILNIRLAACNTNEAHSFHVRQFLGSHGYLDTYIDSLTTSQALYFYRNIRHIEKHAGKTDTFDKLTEHIMSERFVPLVEYTMKHDVSAQAENIYPEVIFRKRQLNLGIVLPKDDQINLPEMLNKEVPLAPDNGTDLQETVADVQMKMENSPSNVVGTKVLESSMIDDSDSSPWTLGEILFNHWLYLSSEDLYLAYININNPKTGEKIPLTAKESFILAMYAFSKSLGYESKTIPLAYASRVQRLPTPDDPFIPSVDDIYSIVDHRLIERDVAVAALSQQPEVDVLLSIDAFYTLGVEINDAVQMQRRLIARQEHFERRGMVLGMVTRIYSDHIIELEPQGTLYDTWLSDRNIDLSEFTSNEFDLLYNDIVGQATGVALHPTQSMREMQKAMVDMFTQLSSYGIQVIREINDSSVRKTDWPGVRLGDTKVSLSSHPRIPDAALGIDRITQIVTQDVEIALNHPAIDPHIHQVTSHKAESNSTVRLKFGQHPTTYNHVVNLGNIQISSPDPEDIVIPRGWVSFVGIEYFLKLDPDQLTQVGEVLLGIDVKGPGEVGKIPLDQVVIITELLPFDLGDRAEQLGTSVKNHLLGKFYPKGN